MMTNKKRLNALLRLRLFFSTEEELSHLVGLQLRGNHFNRLNDFKAEAFFDNFSKRCREMTHGDIDLATLLEEYENTSAFYQSSLEKTQMEKHPLWMRVLFDFIYLKVIPDDVPSKVTKVCRRYAEKNKIKPLNPGILFLLIHHLLPTFTNKKAQDIPDILTDFQTLHDLLVQYLSHHPEKQISRYRYPNYLQELQGLINDCKASNDRMERILLIAYAKFSLEHMYWVLMPHKIRAYQQASKKIDLHLTTYWQDIPSVGNVVWKISPLNVPNLYEVIRYRIDVKAKRISFSKYNWLFQDSGYLNFYYVNILFPNFMYNSILKKNIEIGNLTYDYCELTLDEDEVSVITFMKNAPAHLQGENPTKQVGKGSGQPIFDVDQLKAITDKNEKAYYQELLEVERDDYEMIDENEEQAVYFEELQIMSDANSLLLFYKGNYYRISKYDEKGNETISGISALTHEDNIVCAVLKDEQKRWRHFLCLDSIQQYIDMEDILLAPFCRCIYHLSDLWSE